MRMYKCDRCGKYVRLEMRSFLREPTMLWRFGHKKHFCGRCAVSYRMWFSDPKAKEESE